MMSGHFSSSSHHDDHAPHDLSLFVSIFIPSLPLFQCLSSSRFAELLFSSRFLVAAEAQKVSSPWRWCVLFFLQTWFYPPMLLMTLSSSRDPPYAIIKRENSLIYIFWLLPEGTTTYALLPLLSFSLFPVFLFSGPWAVMMMMSVNLMNHVHIISSHVM